MINVDELYKQQIMEHYRSPRNKGVLENAEIDFFELNPLCGDEIRLTMKLNGGRVKDVKFDGRGCAISQSSASLMTEEFKEKTLDELKKISQEDVLRKLGINVGPGRLKCVLLILKALQRGIFLYEKSEN
ncbi:MAG: Fe-S cluster assembly sulfur transfer protein SufU [Nanoarchaeota archaeon]